MQEVSALTAFSRDFVPIIQMCLTAGGLLSIFLLWRQMINTYKWNQIKACQDYLNITRIHEIEKNMTDALKAIDTKLNKTRKLSDEQVQNIMDEEGGKTLSYIIDYLNERETFCAAVSREAIDEDYSFGSEGISTVYYVNKFEKIIEKRKEHADTYLAYNELRDISEKWSLRIDEINEKREDDVRESEKKGGIKKYNFKIWNFWK